MKRQNMLHLQKKLEHKYNNDKNMVELDTIVIILINAEVLYVLYVIWNIIHLKKFFWFFPLDWTMIIFLHEKN